MAHDLIELLVFLLLSCRASVCISKIQLVQIHGFQIFSPALQAVFPGCSLSPSLHRNLLVLMFPSLSTTAQCGSDLNGHRQVGGCRKWGLFTQWNIIQP